MQKTGKTYWDNVWNNYNISKSPLFNMDWRRDFVISRFDRLVSKSGYLRKDNSLTLLDIGCARSLWLPYFAQRWGYHVEGLDYSEEGCRQSEEILRTSRVNGTIHQADFTSPPIHLKEKFDYVISNGVLEHFGNQDVCIRQFLYFLKPKGTLFTLIPNLCGAMGKFTRFISPEIYKLHVPISKEDLHEATVKTGMDILHCDYFIAFYLGVLNLEFLRPLVLRSILAGGSNYISRGICRFFEISGIFTKTKMLSPYVLSIGVKQ